MAFPTVAGNNTGLSESIAGTSHTVNLPASISSGDLLVLCLGWTGDPGTVSAAGWTFLANGGSSRFITVGYKSASGGEGATVTVTSANSVKGAFISYRVTGWSGTPEQGTAATGASGNADPPTVSPSWGSADNLFIAIMAMANASAANITAAPANYSNLQAQGSSGGGGTIATGSAERQLAASNDDPGTFTNTSVAWTAQTIVIKPVAAASTVKQLGLLGVG